MCLPLHRNTLTVPPNTLQNTHFNKKCLFCDALDLGQNMERKKRKTTAPIADELINQKQFQY